MKTKGININFRDWNNENQYSGGCGIFGYLFVLYLFITFICCIVSCGGSGGGVSGDGGTGTLSMNITDAKPALPINDIQHVWITIDEIRVHKSGSGWTTLDLPEGRPTYEIDLLEYRDGDTTTLVLPVDLSSGKYTQMRFGVRAARMVTSEGDEITLEIPSEYLKTDKNFEFDLPSGGEVAITIDFDLSQSIVATGSGTYKLKPVLHIVRDPTTIEGSISADAFGSFTEAVVVVTWDRNDNGIIDSEPPPADEEYTRLIVPKADSGLTPFKIFWVEPNNSYIVQIFINDREIFSESIPFGAMPEGTEYILNGGALIDETPVSPLISDANTILLDHFDNSTSASILGYAENWASCGSAKPEATPTFSYGPGRSGLSQALSLSPPTAGSASYLKYSGELLSQDDGTLEFWVFLTSYGGGLSLVDQGLNYGLCEGWTFGMSVSSVGQLSAVTWVAGAFQMNSGTAIVPLNTWTHVAATWGSTGAKLYINGVQVGSDANTGRIPDSGYDGSVMLRLGTHAGITTWIDELRISNIQRTW